MRAEMAKGPVILTLSYEEAQQLLATTDRSYMPDIQGATVVLDHSTATQARQSHVVLRTVSSALIRAGVQQ